MEKPNAAGIRFCKVGLGLGLACASFGLVFIVMLDGMQKLIGLLMLAYGLWVALNFHLIVREPDGVTGWRKRLVAPFLEKSVHADFFTRNALSRASRLHAAKRFSLFSFVACLITGAAGFDALLPALAAGLVAALAFDKFVERREARSVRR